MDGNRFDSTIRDLTQNASRRNLFGGLLGGVATTLAGVSVLEAKKGGKGKAKGHGKQKKAKKQKTSFCHQTGSGYQFITVSQSARKAHLGHGDTECPPDPCKTYTGGCTLAPATCDFTPATQGTACGTGRFCDALGNCI